MQFTNPGSGAARATYYFSPLYSSGPYTANSTIGANFVAMPVACTMSALNVGVNNYNTPGLDVTTLTVYKNGSATGMSCSVTTNNNGSSCQDKTHTFAVSGGDSISVAFSESALAPFNKVVVNLPVMQHTFLLQLTIYGQFVIGGIHGFDSYFPKSGSQSTGAANSLASAPGGGVEVGVNEALD